MEVRAVLAREEGVGASLAQNLRARSGPTGTRQGDPAFGVRRSGWNVRHPGLSHAYNEILTHEGGSEIYLREHRELDGLRFGNLGGAFEDSNLLGVVRSGEDGHERHLAMELEHGIRLLPR